MIPVYYQAPYPIYHQVINLEESPSFRWCQRKLPINWPLVKDVDVNEIISKVDVNSLEYLVQHLAFGNIKDSDKEKFGSEEALKAFQLLQLGCEYLTHLKRPIQTQPDSIDLKKSLSLAQRRVEELELLLQESEIAREKAEASTSIYKRRYHILKDKINDIDEDEGEINQMPSNEMLITGLKKEIEGLKNAIEDRGKFIDKSSPKKLTKKYSRTNANEIHEIFKTEIDNSIKAKETRRRKIQNVNFY